MEISDELVGARVSLRYRIGTRDGRPLFSDAVGELATGDPGSVLVETRRGPVRVDRAAVVAVRAVPPAPPRRASLTAVARLEGLCADAWPAVVDRPLGAWRLRAAGGYTGRANAGLAIGDPGMPVPVALDAVRAFAREQGIPARVQTPTGSPWDRAVEAQGWVLDAGHAAGAEATVLVAAIDELIGPGDSGPGSRVELPDRPSGGWWQLAFGRPPTPAERHVVDPGGTPPVAFAQVRGPGGDVVAQVRAMAVEDHLHLALLTVAPAARRHGLATAVLASAAAWGREHGARWAVLQVALHNTGAGALYEHLGFAPHHRYRYLVPPPG